MCASDFLSVNKKLCDILCCSSYIKVANILRICVMHEIAAASYRARVAGCFCLLRNYVTISGVKYTEGLWDNFSCELYRASLVLKLWLLRLFLYINYGVTMIPSEVLNSIRMVRRVSCGLEMAAVPELQVLYTTVHSISNRFFQRFSCIIDRVHQKIHTRQFWWE